MDDKLDVKILLKQYQLQINKLIEENILLRAQLEQLKAANDEIAKMRNEQANQNEVVD